MLRTIEENGKEIENDEGGLPCPHQNDVDDEVDLISRMGQLIQTMDSSK